MSKTERIRDIYSFLLERKRADVTDLANRFGVSEVTIRKDLTKLEERGLCMRVHGGAILAEPNTEFMPLSVRAGHNVSAKQAIAGIALTFVSDGDVVFVDAGVTCLTLAGKLAGMDVTVVTNSLPVAMELAHSDSASVILIGGALRKASLAMIGPLSWQMVQREGLRVSVAFMGASGFDPERGFSSQNLIEAKTKEAFIKMADTVVVLVEKSKFKKPAFAAFVNLDAVDAVVTDHALDQRDELALRRHAVTIRVANGRR